MEYNPIAVLNQTHGERLALTSADGSLSYAELTESISVLSGWLIDVGTRVLALQADNCVDWVVVDLACQQAGIVCIPLPDFFSETQVRHCLAESAADLLVTDFPEIAISIVSRTELLSPPVCQTLYFWRVDNSDNNLSVQKSSVSLDGPSTIHGAGNLLGLISNSSKAPTKNYPDNTQKITFTSGSTGHPKGVCLSQSHQWQVASSLAERILLNHPRHLCLLPLSTLLENIAGIYSPLLRGGTIIIPDSSERGLSGSSGLHTSAFLDCLTRTEPETMIILPQLLSVIVAACQQGWPAPDSLRFIAVGGARVSPQLLQCARDFGMPVYQGYGLSECASVVALNTPEASNIDSVGKPLPHTDVTIENGEIVVTGSVFLGYLGQPESWYPTQVKTGDTGTLEDSYLKVNGRSKNLLISSFGRNISPEWVETELLANLMISQCLVVGDDQPQLAVLLSAPDQVSAEDIEQWISRVNNSLPDYARVKSWQRLSSKDWQGLITANGRLRRQQALSRFKYRISQLWK
jgi:long-chain acyl-CoA synthetase